MKACGGRYAWDQTRFLRWTFFNRRSLVWDKKEERVRIDFLDQPLKIFVNLKNTTGRVWKDGKEMTEPDSIKKYVERGKNVWINDSYWFVMPFKLKDSGVTLKYVGKKSNTVGGESDVIELTFKNVGVTPDNKYHIYINPSSKLITQWDFFKNYSDEKPQFSNPWQDYRALGNILLSVSRGEGRTMIPMGVYNKLPDSVFTTPVNINWIGLK
ncbi:MAG: hypothetical protein HC817_02120 [Saprospiraceae bacterium]|nr:hypothetical protein [Saprospiraceae bacterium]